MNTIPRLALCARHEIMPRRSEFLEKQKVDRNDIWAVSMSSGIGTRRGDDQPEIEKTVELAPAQD